MSHDHPSLADTIARPAAPPPNPARASAARRMRTLAALALGAGLALLLPSCSAESSTASSTDPAVPAAVPTASAEVAPIVAEPLTGRHLFDERVELQFRSKPDGRPMTVINQTDPSRWTVLKITVQPGARFPWHFHPGPVIVGVTSGDLTLVYADDCVRRPHAQGSVFVDPGNEVHYAFNPGTTPTVLTATFFGVPATGPVTIPVGASEAAANDAKCQAAPPPAHAHAGH